MVGDMVSSVVAVAQGDFDATTISTLLFLEYGEEPLDALKGLGITGHEVELLFRDECGKSYGAMVQRLREGEAIDILRSNCHSKFFRQ